MHIQCISRRFAGKHFIAEIRLQFQMLARHLVNEIAFHILYPSHYRKVIERKQDHGHPVLLRIHLEFAFGNDQLFIFLVQWNVLQILSLQIIHENGLGIPRQQVDMSRLFVYLHVIDHGIFAGTLTDISYLPHKRTVFTEQLARNIIDSSYQYIIIGNTHGAQTDQGFIPSIQFHHLHVFHPITQWQTDGILHQTQITYGQFMSTHIYGMCHYRQFA